MPTAPEDQDLTDVRVERAKFRAAVKHYRKKLGLTQTQFGERMGITQPAASAIEKGPVSASNFAPLIEQGGRWYRLLEDDALILRVAEALEVSPTQLLSGVLE